MRCSQSKSTTTERAANTSAGGGPSMPIEPGEHEVNAAVEVTFALEIGPAS